MVSWGSAHRLHVCCPSRLPGVVPARHPEAAIRTSRLAQETTARISAEHTQQADNLAVPSAHTSRHHLPDTDTVDRRTRTRTNRA